MAYEKDCKAVTTLSGTEYIRALAEDGSTVRIPVAELGKVMAQVMPVATTEKNGLMPSGFMTGFIASDTPDRFLIIKYINKGNYVTLLKTGNYGQPSLYSINTGMSGGAASGFPITLQVRLISGPIVISDAKVYTRDGKDYIELTFNSSIAWCSHLAMDIGNNLDSISMNASDRYNLGDGNLIIGAVIL